MRGIRPWLLVLGQDCLGDLDANRNRKTCGMQGGGGQRYNRETGVFRSANSLVGGIGRGGNSSSRSGSGNDCLGSIGVSTTGSSAAVTSPDDAGGCCDRGSHPQFYSEKYASLAGRATEEAPTPAAAPIAKAPAVKEGAGGRVDASNTSGRRVELRVEVGDEDIDPRVGKAAYYDGVEGAGSIAFAATASEEHVDGDDREERMKVFEDRSQVVAAAGVIGKGLGEEGKPLGTIAVRSENMRNKEEALAGQDGGGLVLLAREADDDALAETPPTGDISGGRTGEGGVCGDSEQTGLPETPLVVVGEGGTHMLSIDTAVVSAGRREECGREQPHQACALSSVSATTATGVSTSSISCPPCRDYDDKSHGKRAEALSHESHCGDRADDIDPGSGVVPPPPPRLPGGFSSNSSVSCNDDSVGQVPQLPLPPVAVSDDNNEAVPEVRT